MAIDLYVNFERFSNNSVFYRTVSSSTQPFTIKIVDNELSQPIGSLYSVEYALQSNAYLDMLPNNYGELVQSITLDTSSPCVCSIKVKVYDGQVLIKSMEMSAVFLENLPSIDFILFPRTYIDEAIPVIKTLNSENYEESPGAFFYGEGHTETFVLSCNYFPYSPETLTWFVGNSGNYHQTNVPITNQTNNTASVTISSTLNDTRVYPIAVKLNNPDLIADGPVITYNDNTGEPNFYPFFSSSLTPYAENLNQRLKSSIKVLKYPELNPPTFVSPFSSTQISLPLDHSPQIFRFSIYNSKPTNLLLEKFLGTNWRVKGASDVGEWTLSTPLLSSILAYQVAFSYDQEANQYLLPTFKTSPLVPTALYVQLTAYKDVRINLFPYDWKPKRIEYLNETKTIVDQYPFVKLFIPNYYYLRGQEVPITIVETVESPFALIDLKITSTHSADSLTLNLSSLSGIMTFNKLGAVELVAHSTILNTLNNSIQQTTLILSDLIEVVPTFDVINEKYFLTSLTPLRLSYNEAPRLSPNEWAIADTVNSVIEKIYATTIELESYTNVYENVSKFYGWLGPEQRASTIPPEFGETPFPVYIWSDLECNSPDQENEYSWKSLECDAKNTNFTWQYHYCEITQKEIDPSCIQRHCLDWRWKKRKQGNGNFNVTWKMTKQNSSLSKRWAYEECTVNAEILGCNRGTWKISTIDPLHFPIPTCSTTQGCSIIDAVYHDQTDQVVFALATEINLVKNDYFGTPAFRCGIADGAFAFQNIVGIETTTEGKIVCLDSLLCRVSVFEVAVNPDELKLTTSWGTYGAADNPRGFNKPNDIHVDLDNSVWVVDTGNKRIKKLSLLGKYLFNIYHENFELNPPLSVCVDANLNVHCLTDKNVMVFDKVGSYLFVYELPSNVNNPKKINASFNRHMIYIAHERGITKFFKTGELAYDIIKDERCANLQKIVGYSCVSQDKYRNLFVAVQDKLLKIPDLQYLVKLRANIPEELFWSLSELLIHKEEYIQPWVYLKSFHRLWDNIELLRNSLTYEKEGCKSHVAPKYKKEELIIGQNELVTNSVINRLSEQLWANVTTLLEYFNPDCKK